MSDFVLKYGTEEEVSGQQSSNARM
jgi:hypothetical protein